MADNLSIEISTPNSNTNYNTIDTSSASNLSVPLATECLFEFLGMYVFITLSLSNVAIYALYPEANLNWTGMSIAWGLNLMFGIYIASFKSPAHLNPAVSLCMFLFKKNITYKQLLYFTLSQLIGAFVAASTVYGVYYNKLGNEDNYGTVFFTSANMSITHYSAWFTEFLGTALLVSGIFILIDNNVTKQHLPIYISLWLSTLIFALGFQTAFAWNPARDFGPRLLALCAGYSSFSYDDYYFWIPLVADYCGAIFGVAFYEYLIKPLIN